MCLNKRPKAILFIVLLLAITQSSFAQRYGLPGILNYPRSEYKAGTQNWAVAQGENGMMYFANNSGLVEFDGSHWNLYKDIALVNRSLCVDNARIYVGAFNNFGYFEANKTGTMVYHSLLPLLQNRISDFDEIWRIHKTSFGIVFQSFRALFIYHDNKIDIVQPRSKFHFSYYVNGLIWIYDEKEGLMQYRDGKVRQIPGGDFFIGTEVWSVLPLNDDQVIIGTAKKGFFRYDGVRLQPWNNQVNELVKKHQLYHSSVINKNYLAFGTIQNGLIVSDTAGNIISEINKERGILNNTVLSIGNDKQGNIWLGLDNGISVIKFNSPLTYIQNYFDIGSGYTTARLGENFYIGTNQGLFYIKWTDFINPLKKKSDFQLIEGTEGQVWSLKPMNNLLLCGHNFGIFQIEGTKAIKISNIPGGWNFAKIPDKNNLQLVGHYSGISIIEKIGNNWVYRNELEGYDQSSHFLAIDAFGDIWVSHDYKGVFRITPDAEYRKVLSLDFYDQRHGLPDKMDNRVFALQAGLVFGTHKGVYYFDHKSQKFKPDLQFKQLLSNSGHIQYIFQDQSNNIWYFLNHHPGVLRLQEDGSLKNIFTPFTELNGQVISTYGHVDVIDAYNVIIGMEGGIAHYNSTRLKNFKYIPPLHISKIQSADTSEGIYRYSSSSGTQQFIPKFRFRNNSINITFAASQFADNEIEFQYRLEGFDSDWSGWSNKNIKDYTNLHEGEYVFKLRARTLNGNVSPILSYSFKIMPPWYRSILAMVIYFIALLVSFTLGYRFFIRSMEKSREKEQEKQKENFIEREQKLKEEALITEKEMIRLRNEKLNMEMIHKEKELANSTMMIIQKNEILNKLKNDLSRLRSTSKDENLKNEITTTVKRIGKEIDNEKQWQVFNLHVEQVHDELFKKLKQNYPELTPRELSLCAYLRMNISSKEIATLMNISTRGVEISRYRIRKKLGLDRHANLTDFMLKL